MSIEIENLTYTYMKKTPYEKDALKNVNLKIEEGSFVAIAGHTGSGKSTLMQHLNGLISPCSGTVKVDGVDINRGGKEKIKARHSVGMVFQYPETQLFEETVYADIAFGPKNFGLEPDAVDKRVKKAMSFVGLDYEQYRDASPFALSGGQMRRVAIAGIVALEPAYLVLDEPTAGLDPKAKHDLLENIRALYRKGNTTIIMVSHNMDDIIGLAGRIIVLHDGCVAADGMPQDIFKKNDILQAAGLRAPHLTQLLRQINEQAFPVRSDCLNKSDAADAVCAAYYGREKDAR
ncbi:energy-coupling factor transporter ATPase [Pectinatus haikarae]|uniref:Energy-coupling factor transporter ATP-binding protein EcfA2 n=1 Tax=Pectinatus haikarae TaxID=349096 RepID=A0ABT9YC79_9FIRM|nr:energy-coupling factor transporter ATPase [Pectinatus haikarae]MDQ0205126.1 energy-coupling factor transport system ATP-binding protein [Pectinatus haikarae]